MMTVDANDKRKSNMDFQLVNETVVVDQLAVLSALHQVETKKDVRIRQIDERLKKMEEKSGFDINTVSIIFQFSF
jgi:hypothetical protein